MKLHIGRRITIDVETLAQASKAYLRIRDESGEGASTFPSGRIESLYVSYNGKIWDRKMERVVYSPYAA